MIGVGRVAVIREFLHAGQERATLPGTEEPMTTAEFITALLDLQEGSCDGRQ